MTTVAVRIEDRGWRALPQIRTLVRRAAQAASKLENARSVTVLLTDDSEVKALNGRFRGEDKPTNVLAFPAGELAGEHLGDLALAYGVCSREAVEQGKALGDHLSHLVVHGVLHLVGHDHLNDEEAEAMEALERRVLAGLSIGDPYAAHRSEAIHG